MPSTVAFADSDQRGDSVASTLNLPFKLNEEEESAVNALAEFTVSGKPDLKHLLAEEVASSPGKMLLAACGPPACKRPFCLIEESVLIPPS